MVIIISGLPTSVLQKAAAKSREFEATYGKYRKVLSETNSLNQSWVDEITTIVQKLNNAATNLSWEETVSDGSLMELQCKARKLLQQC
jgi:DNA mismatch repair protein MSH6